MIKEALPLPNDEPNPFSEADLAWHALEVTPLSMGSGGASLVEPGGIALGGLQVTSERTAVPVAPESAPARCDSGAYSCNRTSCCKSLNDGSC